MNLHCPFKDVDLEIKHPGVPGEGLPIVKINTTEIIVVSCVQTGR